jgi:hypothetical protein
MEALTYVILLLSAVGVPRGSAWRIAREKVRLEEFQLQSHAATVFQKVLRARMELLLYKCCVRIGWYRALPGVPAFVNQRDYMYACLRHLFTVGPWRVYWRHCFARGRFILCLPNLVWPALWLDRAYLCETEIADQYSHYFAAWEGFAITYELSLRMPGPGHFSLDMRGIGGLATSYCLILCTQRICLHRETGGPLIQMMRLCPVRGLPLLPMAHP